ncbi:MAG: DUF3261 domain-containing protein [Deltaproteobacteria bacterium]|nr:DUF3261 domain-containing protein [Deltaproteobacteria bacterium]
MAMMRLPISKAISALFLLTACGGSSAVPDGDGPGYPTHIEAPSTFPGEWAIEQEVSIRHAEGENSFHAVLQKRGDQIVMMGLGPAGGRAFALTQEGVHFEWETFLPIELPFPPEYMLYDVHRTWLQPNNPPLAGAAEAIFERHGERVRELWDGARLMERTFERLDGRPEGTIVVRYLGGLSPDAPAASAPPDEVIFENRWHGYTATIRTLEYTPI